MDGMSGRMKGVQGPWPRRTARKGEDKTNRKARGGLKGLQRCLAAPCSSLEMGDWSCLFARRSILRILTNSAMLVALSGVFDSASVLLSSLVGRCEIQSEGTRAASESTVRHSAHRRAGEVAGSTPSTTPAFCYINECSGK